MQTRHETPMSEVALYDTKWFDYRLMTPNTSDLKCALCYGLSLMDYNELLGLSRHVNVLKGLNVTNIEAWNKHKQIRKLRQWCDARGWRYEEFWALTTKAHLELGMKPLVTKFKDGRMVEYIPFNVFLNKSILKWADANWHEQFGRFVRYADLAFFSSNNYTGHPVQDAYCDYLLKSALRRGVNHTKRLIGLMQDGRLSAEYLNKVLTRSGECTIPSRLNAIAA